jgi:sigma-B regulation protein RsbU (phosphoserine phosphatase)
LRHETSGRGDLDSTVSSLKSDVPYLPPTKATTFDWTPEEPGTYVFEVQAIDRDLNYSEPASVELKVIPDPRNHRIIQLEEHIHQQELAELERVHRELEDARQIQQSLLPEQPPLIEGFEIAGASLPAREVSGDFYDYLAMGENTGIALADVTGKSVKAAMIAAMANGMLHAEVRERVDVWDSPGMILRQLNTGLGPRLSRGMFTAMSLGVLQMADKRLLFSNAGMMYPVVKRGERVWELKVNGVPLGLMEGAEYQDLSLDLKRGDLVIFYSDGIIEAENEAGEMYQTERLLELMQRADPGLSAQDMVDLIVRDVTGFVGEEESSDDITVVVLRCEE